MNLFKLPFLILICLLWSCTNQTKSVWLEELDINNIYEGWGKTQAAKSIDGNQLSIAGKQYKHGIGTHALSTCVIDLNGNATRFKAVVGIDDEVGGAGSAKFYVVGDGKVIWTSKLVEAKRAVHVDLDINGYQQICLVTTDGDDGNGHDHTNWAEAQIEYQKTKPEIRAVMMDCHELFVKKRIVSEPVITSAGILKVDEGEEFKAMVTAVGKLPIRYRIPNCPKGVAIDETSGELRGQLTGVGDMRIRIEVENQFGKDYREILLRVVDGQEH